MNKMKLPLINETTKPFYPRDNKCPICSTKIGEPNTFVVLSGGALKKVEEGIYEGLIEDLFGFLDITFHGAHDKGKGKHKDVFISKEIAKHSRLGQFSLYFCSLQCLKKFLNNIIDEMEEELTNN